MQMKRYEDRDKSHFLVVLEVMGEVGVFGNAEKHVKCL